MTARRAAEHWWRRAWVRDPAATVALGALILGLHLPALHYGLFMDDHAHFRQLQESDWSLRGLTEACRLELVGGVADVWFLPECTLRFFRPLAFGLMKLTYTLGGWSPMVMHAASLTWHLLVCVLLMRLLRRLGATAGLAWGMAGLFALHPGLLVTIEWIACQTELMVTAFLLGATLCYLNFRGWSQAALPNTTARARVAWAVGCVVLFGAALGCRENAIAFPAVMLAIEALHWRRRTRDALAAYAAFALVVAAYLLIRAAYLGGTALPPRPYVYTPQDPGFLRFVFDKACYYLLGEFLLAPIVPFGGLYYLRDRPGMFYGLAAAVGLLLLLVTVRFWRRKPGALGPVWLLGFMTPVLPAFASPHHLYLPAAGWAVTVMLLLRGIGGGAVSISRRRRGLMWACLLLLGAGFAAATVAFGVAIDTAQRVEDQVAREIAARAEGIRDGDTLYIANLPIIAHYVRLPVEQQTGRRNLHVCPLTWAPRVLGLVGTDIEAELTWIDPHTIEMRVAGGRYFAGPMGRLVAEASGARVPVPEPPAAARLGFTVEVLEEDEDGVAGLRFRFDRPLTDPRVHLFWGSPVRWACELRPEDQ